MDFKSFDWRSLKKYTSSQSFNDFSLFLDKLPQLAGQSALMAAGIAWACGAAIGLFATIEAKKLTELRATYRETEALKPDVPTIQNVPVSADELQKFATVLSGLYSSLKIQQQGANISITSPSTSSFGEFREAIGHIQNGGNGWRVTVDSLCVGRECDREKLSATLKINKVSVETPVK